jgi:hypothetical protein
MYLRALCVWGGLLVLAIVNGALREATLVPAFGDGVAHAISSITLAAAILVLAWMTIGWIAPATPAAAWRVGGMWLGLTLAFEFLAGHYLFGTSWRVLLADYDLLHGRLWLVVLAATLVAPLVAGRPHRPGVSERRSAIAHRA